MRLPLSRNWARARTARPSLPRPGRSAAWWKIRVVLTSGLVLVMAALTIALAVQVGLRWVGHPAFVVYGGSMGDAVPVGSLAVTSWVDDEDVEVGDIILSRRASGADEELPVAHRVVALGTQEGRRVAETKGDANESSDPQAAVLGDRVLKLSVAVPYLGYLLGFAGTPLGWIILITLPGALLTASVLKGIWGAPGLRPLPQPRWQT